MSFRNSDFVVTTQRQKPTGFDKKSDHKALALWSDFLKNQGFGHPDKSTQSILTAKCTLGLFGCLRQTVSNLKCPLHIAQDIENINIITLNIVYVIE